MVFGKECKREIEPLAKGELSRNMQDKDRKKQLITGLVNIVIGGGLVLASLGLRGTNLEDFAAGVMMGVGCGDMLVGVYVIARTFRK